MVMEYAAMLSSPGLVSGMKELLDDPDKAVVKRTVRVFTNIYRHALQLIGTTQLDEVTLTNAWPAVSSVADHLLGMLPQSENEGITVHVVRFLEAAVVAHLVFDTPKCPILLKAAPVMVKRGVDALTRLVTTPYVGGSAYLVAVRALITVACYKPDLWGPVTNMLQQQIQAPPPTLFDHNVRSLHKTLQRNLFRLLRRANTQALRSQLIEMMVTVGVPRRMLSQWAAPQEPRKRPSQATEDDITGRGTPPGKRARPDPDSIPTDPKKSPPQDPRDPRIVRDPRIDRDSRPDRDPRLDRNPRAAGDARDPRDPRDPRDRRDPRSQRHSPPQDIPTCVQEDLCQTQKPGSPPVKKHEKNTTSSNTNEKHLEFLQQMINSKSAAASPEFFATCSQKERLLYDRLDHPRVVSLVLTCLDPAPNTRPEDLLRQLGRNGDVTGVREQLARLLAPHVEEDFITRLEPVVRPSPQPTPSPPSTPLGVVSPPSPPSSSRSTPSDAASLSLSDTDLRQVDVDLRKTDVDLRHFLNKGFHTTGDIDMRTQQQPHNPRRSPQDPSLAPDPRTVLAESKLAELDAKLKVKGGDSKVEHVEHRNEHLDLRDPRGERKDPRTERMDPRMERKYSRNEHRDPRNDVNDSRTSQINTSTQLDPRIAISDSHTSQINTSTQLDPRIAMSRSPMSNPGEMCSNSLDPRITQAFADARPMQEPMMMENGGNPNFKQGGNPNMDFNGHQNNLGHLQENGLCGNQNYHNNNQGDHTMNQNFSQGFNQGPMQGFNQRGNQNFDQGPLNKNFNPNFGQQPQNFVGNQNFNQQQHNFMGNPQQNFMGNANNVLSNFDLPPHFANDGGNGRQDPRMMGGGPTCGGPPMNQMGNMNPHNSGFMGPRQPMYDPRVMSPGPWQGNMQQNRLMLMNGGSMFPPQAPPMHL